MLPYTFCGLGGLESDAEKALWKSGVWSWNDYRRIRRIPFSIETHNAILDDLKEAQLQFQNGYEGLRWFSQKIPASHHCRLLPHILDRCVYLNIETTGLSSEDTITVLSVYNGSSCRTFVRGTNLKEALWSIPSQATRTVFPTRVAVGHR